MPDSSHLFFIRFIFTSKSYTDTSNWILLTVLVFLFASCARLPDYASPQRIDIDTNARASTQKVTYRALNIEDFRAKTDPVKTKDTGKHIAARICTNIRLAKGTKFHIESKPQYSQFEYYGRIKRIAFEAVMLPEYSWWSSTLPPFNWPYTLQHEQIHFALTELTARRLSKKIQRKMQNFVVNDTSKEGAKEQLKRKVAALLQETHTIETERQLEFDLETSLYFDPKKQQEWFDDITLQLQDISLEQ